MQTKIDFYNPDDFEDIEKYVDKHIDRRSNYSYVVSEEKFPFSLERVIIWLVNHIKNKRLFFVTSFVFEGQNIEVLLGYYFKNNLLVSIPEWDVEANVGFSKYVLMQKGEMEEKVDDIILEFEMKFGKQVNEHKGFTLPLAELREDFDPNFVTDETRIQNKYIPEIKKVIAQFYKDFEIMGESFSMEASLESGQLGSIVIDLSQSRSGWTDEDIGLLFQQNTKNTSALKELLPRKIDFQKYITMIDEVSTLITISSEEMQLEIRIFFVVILAEDYWATFGYYETRLENLCSDNSRYGLEELLEWAKEWNIQSRDKKIICAELADIIDKLEWSDVKGMLQ